MTKIQQFLADLSEEKKSLFVPVFGSMEKFYTVVYLIARNEHVTDQEKPDRYEDRLQVIRQIRNRVEKLVSSYGLDGGEIVADIASDYFEDYVNYYRSPPCPKEQLPTLGNGRYLPTNAYANDASYNTSDRRKSYHLPSAHDTYGKG